MKRDWLRDRLERFHRLIVGRNAHWSQLIVRIAIIVLLCQITFLLFAIGLRFLVWVTSGLWWPNP